MYRDFVCLKNRLGGALVGGLILAALPLLLLCCGPQAIECKEGVNNLGLDPKGSTCSRDCDCNNINYEGRCTEGKCVSTRRDPCNTKGSKRQCLLPDSANLKCKWGVQECQPPPLEVKNWGDCKPFEPVKEDALSPCGDGLDNDCNGTVDKSDSKCKGFCLPGKQEPCYTGPIQTANEGLCSPGSRTCKDDGSWGECQQQILPQDKDDNCDGRDDDCDGLVDEDASSCPQTSLCTVGEQRDCYGGLGGCRRDGTGRTVCTGLCRAGFKVCRKSASGGVEWSECQKQVVPTFEECDGFDNNCDGTIDEGCLCTLGTTQKCYGGPKETAGQGACTMGTQTCNRLGIWGSCVGQHAPQPEVCNGVDDDCNGLIAEDENKLARPLCDKQNGVCLGARKRCGGKAGWITCATSDYNSTSQNRYVAESEGNTEEAKCDRLDNDCDGSVDEDCPGKQCRDGASRACYTGASGTESKGLCRAGLQFCAGGTWGACLLQVQPTTERCDGQDNDCNGSIDDNASCPPGLTCKDGYCLDPRFVQETPVRETPSEGQTPDERLTSEPTEVHPDAAPGEPTPETSEPTPEDGGAREQPSATGCTNGASRACYTGAAGTESKGLCRAGLQFCINGAWGSCSLQVLPAPERCDGQDNDCNGSIDDNATCPASLTCKDGYCVNPQLLPEPTPETTADGGGQETPPEPCQNGATRACDTSAQGICKGGQQSCQGGAWGPCIGLKVTTSETCNGLDDDCNGIIDDNLTDIPTNGTCAKQDGVCKGATRRCQGSAGWSSTCNERDYKSHAAAYQATEALCDGLDNDCNGQTDEGCPWTLSYLFSNIVYPKAIVTDNQSNLYVAGTFASDILLGSTKLSSTNGTFDIFVAKFSKNGSLLWMVKAGAAGSDEASGIAIDATGQHLYITGYYTTASSVASVKFGSLTLTHQNSGGGQDIFIARLNANDGSFVWVKGFGGISSDRGNGITVDNNGDIITVGHFGQTVQFGSTILQSQGGSSYQPENGFVLKLKEVNDTPQVVWVKQIGSVSSTKANRVHATANNDLIVTGFSEGLDIHFDTLKVTKPGQQVAFLAKLTTSGTFLWAKLASISPSSAGIHLAINTLRLDANANIYLGGYYHNTLTFGTKTLAAASANNREAFLAKLDNTGKTLWLKGITSSQPEHVSDLQLDTKGNIYAIGSSGNAGSVPISFDTKTLVSKGSADIFITKFDPNGSCLWATLAAGVGADDGAALVLAPDNNLYATGIHRGGTLGTQFYQSHGFFVWQLQACTTKQSPACFP